MKEYSIIVDGNNYYKDQSELISYLKSLNGVEEVIVDSKELLKVDVKYAKKIINDEMIRLEILAFLDLQNYPSIYGFDKHTKDVVCKKYKYNICCEFCFGNIIYNLVDTKGIEKVESDFYEKYWKSNKRDVKYNVSVYYDPHIINKKSIKKLEEEIGVYG